MAASVVAVAVVIVVDVAVVTKSRAKCARRRVTRLCTAISASMQAIMATTSTPTPPP
jgi:hypothetical protein